MLACLPLKIRYMTLAHEQELYLNCCGKGRCDHVQSCCLLRKPVHKHPAFATCIDTRGLPASFTVIVCQLYRLHATFIASHEGTATMR